MCFGGLQVAVGRKRRGAVSKEDDEGSGERVRSVSDGVVGMLKS